VPEPEHSIDSCTHSFMFTPEATAAAIVGSFVLGCATSPWLQAAREYGEQLYRDGVAMGWIR